VAHEKRQAVFGEVGNDVFGREGLKVLFDGPELGEGAWCPSVLVAHGVGEDVDAVKYIGIGIVQHAAEAPAKLALLLYPVIGRHLETCVHLHTLGGPEHAEAYVGGGGSVGTVLGLEVEADGVLHGVGQMQ